MTTGEADLNKIFWRAKKHQDVPLHNIMGMTGLPYGHTFDKPLFRSSRFPHYVFTGKDKKVLRRLAEVLSAVYSPAFLGFSHGWISGKGPPSAAKYLCDNMEVQLPANTQFVLIKTDIEDCFNSISQKNLMRILGERISDGELLGLIQRFFKHDIFQTGWPGSTDLGVYPGSNIGPVLCNVYLHRALDQWFAGRFLDMTLVRYADDFVILAPAGEEEEVLNEISDRLFHRYKLKLNYDKTRCVYPQQGERLSFVGHEIWIEGNNVIMDDPHGHAENYLKNKGIPFHLEGT